MKMERMGDKLAENILHAVDQSRNPNLARLIYALGIRNVGIHLADVLAKHAGSIENLAGQGMDDLTAVHEVGPIVAKSIENFFHTPRNLRVLEKLKEGGVIFPVQEAEKQEQPFAGKAFVLTGSLDSFTRDEARKAVEGMGGRITTSVSKKTDFLILGKEPGSKYDKAQKMGIPILDEMDFERMIEKRSLPVQSTIYSGEGE